MSELHVSIDLTKAKVRFTDAQGSESTQRGQSRLDAEGRCCASRESGKR